MDTINKTLAQAYLDMYETKEVKTERKSWVPEAIADEDVADFMGAAAAAAKAGKKEFKFGDKTYKVTMKKDTVDAISDEVAVKVSFTFIKNIKWRETCSHKLSSCNLRVI